MIEIVSPKRNSLRSVRPYLHISLLGSDYIGPSIANINTLKLWVKDKQTAKKENIVLKRDRLKKKMQTNLCGI